MLFHQSIIDIPNQFLCPDCPRNATGSALQVSHASLKSPETSRGPVGPLGLPLASFPTNYSTQHLELCITRKEQLGLLAACQYPKE